MTKNEVIEKLFISKNFNDCINKMEPDHLRDDLRSEVMLIMCECDESKILYLHEKNELQFFVVRVILNLARSSSSPFAKKFRQQTIEFDMQDHPVHDSNEIVNRFEKETKEEVLINYLIELREGKEAGLYWYNAGLLKLYLEHGSYRAIEKETGIPYISCYKNIQQSCAELKKRTEKETYENI